VTIQAFSREIPEAKKVGFEKKNGTLIFVY
jgi:hypothetical protein